ncbi:ribosomal protein L7/L12 [Actinomadura kijaniata]|uniref:ribosomal protein L7/L12 n=1 Tax=Actinomadura kijaniata TaxID=46161 RepID=UPI003F1C6E96
MEEPGFGVLLTRIGERRLDTVQAVRSITGWSAWRSRQLFDELPAVVVEEIWWEAADEAAVLLKTSGAQATVVCRWCRRATGHDAAPLESQPCAAPYWPATRCRASRPGDASALNNLG